MEQILYLKFIDIAFWGLIKVCGHFFKLCQVLAVACGTFVVCAGSFIAAHGLSTCD